MTERNEPGVVTEQLELLELYLNISELAVRDAQQRSLFKPCRFGKLDGCIFCKIKRHILKKRYN